jgi:hypothetical protein
VSKTKSYDERIADIKKGLKTAAKEKKQHPSEVDKAAFKKHAKNINDWDLREVGGFAAIKKELFPLNEDELAELSKNKIVKNYVNRVENTAGSEALFRKTLLDSCMRALKGLTVEKHKVKKSTIKSKGKKMTMEAMLSDLHYGKKTKIVNLAVLRSRLQAFRDVFLFELESKEKVGYQVEKIIVAMIGDLIESFSMHGLESAMSSEFGNAEQIQSAITSLYEDFLLPIALLGKPVHCPCISGNHDRTEREKTFNKPGKSYVSWIIYNTLKELCKAAKLTNVTFDIPEESFTTVTVYGSVVLYEHGDKLKKPDKISMETKIINRQKQLGKTIHMARFGHWHEYICVDRGRAIVNESLPGPDSYSVENGYTSSPGQVINFYIETKNRPTSFYYSFPVFLG